MFLFLLCVKCTTRFSFPCKDVKSLDNLYKFLDSNIITVVVKKSELSKNGKTGYQIIIQSHLKISNNINKLFFLNQIVLNNSLQRKGDLILVLSVSEN